MRPRPARSRHVPVRALAGTLSVAAFSGCVASAPLPREVPATTPSEEEPHPQGVAIDPVLELPAPAVSADSETRLAVLAEPIDPEPARRVVRDFFEAVASESLTDLSRLFDAGAHVRTSGRPPRPEPALPHFRRRFEVLDYKALAGEVFYSRSEMEARTARDAQAVNRPLPVVPRGTDVVVRVSVSGQTALSLFGPELTFLLKRVDAGRRDGSNGPEGAAPGRTEYKIADLYEDFRLP